MSFELDLSLIYESLLPSRRPNGHKTVVLVSRKSFVTLCAAIFANTREMSPLMKNDERRKTCYPGEVDEGWLKTHFRAADDDADRKKKTLNTKLEA